LLCIKTALWENGDCAKITSSKIYPTTTRTKIKMNNKDNAISKLDGILLKAIGSQKETRMETSDMFTRELMLHAKEIAGMENAEDANSLELAFLLDERLHKLQQNGNIRYSTESGWELVNVQPSTDIPMRDGPLWVNVNDELPPKVNDTCQTSGPVWVARRDSLGNWVQYESECRFVGDEAIWAGITPEFWMVKPPNPEVTA